MAVSVLGAEGRHVADLVDDEVLRGAPHGLVVLLLVLLVDDHEEEARVLDAHEYLLPLVEVRAPPPEQEVLNGEKVGERRWFWQRGFLAIAAG